MKIKTNLIYFTLIASLFFVTSCGDDDNDEIINKGVPINSIEASSTTSLEGRNDWVFNLGSTVNYKFEIDGKALKATPDSEIQYFKEKCKEGEVYMNGLMPSLSVYFQPKDYYTTILDTRTSVEPRYPNIINQETKEGLIYADILRGGYKGVVSKDIRDLKLVHENSLLDIELVNLPTGYKMEIPFVRTDLNYKPYKIKENAYRVVYAIQSTNVYIKNGAGSIVEKFDLPAASDQHYTIKVYYNETTNSFTSSSTVSGWSDVGDVLLKDIN